MMASAPISFDLDQWRVFLCRGMSGGLALTQINVACGPNGVTAQVGLRHDARLAVIGVELLGT
jgi:hypothetical protein